MAYSDQGEEIEELDKGTLRKCDRKVNMSKLSLGRN